MYSVRGLDKPLSKLYNFVLYKGSLSVLGVVSQLYSIVVYSYILKKCTVFFLVWKTKYPENLISKLNSSRKY